MWMAWGFATWALMIAMWWIMMIAMMTPSATPTILLYARVYRHALVQGQIQDKLAPTGAFAAGYLLVWLGFAAAAATLHWALERAGLVSAMMMGSQSRLLSGAVLITAGRLSALAAQKYLPSALPHAHVVSFAPLASARPGCAPPRRNARRVLCRLLLAADGTVVRGRRDEPDLDRCARHSGADREGATPGPMGRPRRRHRPHRLGRRHARGLRPEHHHLDRSLPR